MYAKTSSGAYRLMRDLVRTSNNLMGFVVRLGKLSKDEQTQRSLKYLEVAGYLDHLDKDRYRLTDLAKINLLREIVAKRKPDGEIRLVIFDIPEHQRSRRNAFRRHLIDLGFRMAQQSVWISHRPCEDLVRLVVKYHGMKPYVQLIVGKAVTASYAAA